jgi:four helix bundle protein
MKYVNGFKGLRVYQSAFDAAMEIFRLTKKFPKEEMYSLTDQIRKSSRSVCANISEGYSKRNYPKHFKSKLAISDGEAMETITWLDFALACEYIDEATHARHCETYISIGKMLGKMTETPEKFKSRT